MRGSTLYHGIAIVNTNSLYIFFGSLQFIINTSQTQTHIYISCLAINCCPSNTINCCPIQFISGRRIFVSRFEGAIGEIVNNCQWPDRDAVKFISLVGFCPFVIDQTFIRETKICNNSLQDGKGKRWVCILGDLFQHEQNL